MVQLEVSGGLLTVGVEGITNSFAPLWDTLSPAGLPHQGWLLLIHVVILCSLISPRMCSFLKENEDRERGGRGGERLRRGEEGNTLVRIYCMRKEWRKREKRQQRVSCVSTTDTQVKITEKPSEASVSGCGHTHQSIHRALPFDHFTYRSRSLSLFTSSVSHLPFAMDTPRVCSKLEDPTPGSPRASPPSRPPGQWLYFSFWHLNIFMVFFYSFIVALKVSSCLSVLKRVDAHSFRDKKLMQPLLVN